MVLKPDGFQVLGSSNALLREHSWADGFEQGAAELNEAFGSDAEPVTVDDPAHYGPGSLYDWGGFRVWEFSELDPEFSIRVEVGASRIGSVEVRTAEGIAVGTSLSSAYQLGLVTTGDGLYAADPTDPQDPETSVYVGVAVDPTTETVSRLYAPHTFVGNL